MILAAAQAGAAAALPAPFRQQPLAVCPPGPVSLHIAPAARSVHRLGPFSVSVTGHGLTVGSGSRVLWSSVPGVPFVGAAASLLQAPQLAGFAFVHVADTSRCWREQTVSAARSAGRRLVVAGTLGPGAPYSVTFAERSAQRLAMTVHVGAPGASVALLTSASPADEAIHGFGALTRWNIKGGIVPIITREQGVGRGEPVVTRAEDKLLPPQGGAWNTSYAVVPEYLTSQDRGFFWSDEQYGAFDLRHRGRIAMQLWHTTIHAQILNARTPAGLISAYTQFAGRMRRLPAWTGRGAIVGIEGGTAAVRRRVGRLRRAGVPLAGVWLQDWSGQRHTAFGSRLIWNWTLDRRHYPGWTRLVSDLRREGIRVLTYVNPMLAAGAVPKGEPDLYAIAARRGYLVKAPSGGVYQLVEGGFTAGVIDLSNPAARRWTVSMLRRMAQRFGASGYMADFGEQAPSDGVYDHGTAVYDHGTAAYWHNAYPAEWAKVVARATRGTDVVGFLRSAAATSPRHARLFWMGDQNVDWSAQDGMRSALTGMLSGGLAGFALDHSDTGGYTTLTHPRLHRSPELLERWSEMNAFGGAILRTHEGNRPSEDAQVYGSAARARRFAVWARVFAALAPYRQGLEREASATGLPIVRPLWLTWPALGAITREFTLGRRVLVAPTFAPGARTTRVRLPPGRWIAVWSGRRVAGGRTLAVATPLGRPAVFTRSRRLRNVIAGAAARR